MKFLSDGLRTGSPGDTGNAGREYNHGGGLMRRHFKKVPGGLIPAFHEDEIWLSRKKTGALLELDIREPRNGALHRKWWALANYLAEHSDRFPTAEHASKYLLIQLGYCVWIERHRDESISALPIADSISFASMDDDKFSEMYGKACDLLCEIIPHVSDQNIKQTLAEFAGVGALMGVR